MGVRHQGFALIVVLIAVAAVFALAMQGAVMSRSTMLEVGAIHQRVVAERRARAAVVIALTGLVPSQTTGGATGADTSSGVGAGSTGGAAPVPAKKKVELPDFLIQNIPELKKLEEQAKEQVGQDPGVVARATDGNGMASRVPRRRALSMLSDVGIPSAPVRVDVDGSAFRVRMWDALGLLNVNKADEPQLTRYFLAKGVNVSRATSLAEQILDWRDTDRVPHKNGAEDDVYSRMGVTCRNADIYSLEELLFLPAMDRALFDRIKDDLAVGGDGTIHVGTAPRAVLASIPGMTDEAVDGIMRLRADGALTEKSLDAILPKMHRDAIENMLRWSLSGVLRVRVDALEGKNDRVMTRFDGAAMVSDTGVQEVGLRPM